MSLVTMLARATQRAPRARALFAAPVRDAMFPRALGLVTVPSPLVFYVKRACGAAFTSVEVPAAAGVSTLVKVRAAIRVPRAGRRHS